MARGKGLMVITMVHTGGTGEGGGGEGREREREREREKERERERERCINVHASVIVHQSSSRLL